MNTQMKAINLLSLGQFSIRHQQVGIGFGIAQFYLLFIFPVCKSRKLLSPITVSRFGVKKLHFA